MACEPLPSIYMAMIETAEIVAERYEISREVQDEFAVISHARTALGIKKGAFDKELAPLPTIKKVIDKETKEISDVEVILKYNEGLRDGTNFKSLQNLEPVFKNGQDIKPGSFITAGNASQLSDGASASVLMVTTQYFPFLFFVSIRAWPAILTPDIP